MADDGKEITSKLETESQQQSNSTPGDKFLTATYVIGCGQQIVYASTNQEETSMLDFTLTTQDSPDVEFELEIADEDTNGEASEANGGDDVFGRFKGSISDKAVVKVTSFISAEPRAAGTGQRGAPQIKLSLNQQKATWVKLWDYLEEKDTTWELYLTLKIGKKNESLKVVKKSNVFTVVKRYLEFLPVVGGYLREDVAPLWTAASAAAARAGATLESPYGDTVRPLSVKGTPGSSPASIHYCGRAVDINQELWGTRYFPVLDGVDHWIVWCKADKQDGTQGTKIEKDTTKWRRIGAEEELEAGWYVNLTDILSSHGFDRIPAQSGWESNSKKMEWWHFAYTVGLGATFADEMQKVGYGRKYLKDKGWTDAELDREPG